MTIIDQISLLAVSFLEILTNDCIFDFLRAGGFHIKPAKCPSLAASFRSPVRPLGNLRGQLTMANSKAAFCN